MNNGDYVILIDENGQPYIAHSVFSRIGDAAKSAGRTAHKYIAKVGEGAKARYFYTQEELKAFYNRGKAAAGKAAETVRGAATKAATAAKSAAASVSKHASDRLGDVSDFVHRRNNKRKTAEPYIEKVPGATVYHAGKHWLHDGYVDMFEDNKSKLKATANSNRTDNATNNAPADDSRNTSPYEARRQKLVQDIMDAQDAARKVSRYSEEGRQAQEDLERAWARLGEYYDNIGKGPIDDKYRAGQLTKKKK